MAAFVSLIGAGPGDPELITVRGQRALAAAEVIIHDDLVDRRLLIPFSDRPVYGLGDRRAPAAERRRRLHRLLAEQAAAGRRVAHLKGGDPLLFARAVEEIRFLRAAGISYEVVPGITAALAAAAYAELPLTRRRRASSVAFCTGHSEQPVVPGADTLCITWPRRGWPRWRSGCCGSAGARRRRSPWCATPAGRSRPRSA